MALDDADRFCSLFEDWGGEPVLFLADGSFRHDELLQKVRCAQGGRTWTTDRVAFDGVTSHYLEGLIRSLPFINGKMYEALGELVQTNPSRFAILSLDCRGLLQKNFRTVPHDFIETAGRLDIFPWVVEMCGTIPTYQYSSGRDLSAFLPALRTITPSHVVVLEGDKGSRGAGHIVRTLQTAGVALDVCRISSFAEAEDWGSTTFVASAAPLLQRLARPPPAPTIPRLLRAEMVQRHQLALGAAVSAAEAAGDEGGESDAEPPRRTTLLPLPRISRAIPLGGALATGAAEFVTAFGEGFREALPLPTLFTTLFTLERDTYVNGSGLRVPRPAHMRGERSPLMPVGFGILPRDAIVGPGGSDGGGSGSGGSGSGGGSETDSGRPNAAAPRPAPDLDPKRDIVLPDGGWGSCRICFIRRAAVQYACGHADCRTCYVGWRKEQNEKGFPHTCPQCRAAAGPPLALLID